MGLAWLDAWFAARKKTNKEAIRSNDISSQKDLKDKITNEPVLSVTSNGLITVGGRVGGKLLATMGNAQVQVGELVHVLWKNGEPVGILKHRFKKAQFNPTPVIAGDLLEQVFVATDSDTGIKDVYYRNKAQLVALGVRDIIGVEEIIGVKFIDAYPDDVNEADPDVRTLIIVRTFTGIYTEDPETIPGTRNEKFYIFSLTGKDASKVQKAQISGVELIRVESTNDKSMMVLDWDFNLLQEELPLRVYRFRTDSLSAGPEELFTVLGQDDYATPTTISHQHRTFTLAQLIPGFISTFFEEFVQATIRDYWLDPVTGNLIWYVTIEMSGVFPAFDPDIGDTSSSYHYTLNGNNQVTPIVTGPILEVNQRDTDIRISPESHALLIDATTQTILWASLGSITKSFQHTILTTGIGQVYGHIAHYANGVFAGADFDTTDQAPDSSGIILDFADDVAGTSEETEKDEDGFEGDEIFDHSAMYSSASLGPSSVQTVSQSFFTGGLFIRTGRYRIRRTSETINEITKVTVGKINDFRHLRWAPDSFDRRTWISRWNRPRSGSFATVNERPMILDGDGIVIFDPQLDRRLSLRPTGTGSFNDGFLRLLTVNEHHVLFRSLLGLSNISNLPKDSLYLMNFDTGVIIEVINFPLSESPTNTGTVQWDIFDGEFSQIEAALDFFSERNIRLIRRDYAFATIEDTELRQFVIAWDEDGVPTLISTEIEEDTDLDKFKEMFELPDQVTPDADPILAQIVTPLTAVFFGFIDDTNSIKIYLSDWRLINDQSKLGAAFVEE